MYANIIEFEIINYDDETFKNIIKTQEYKERFIDEVTPLPFSDSKKEHRGTFSFDKTKGIAFYNSVNLSRIIDGLSEYFTGETKRKVIGFGTFYRAMEIRMYQAQLKQVKYIESIFQEYGVEVKYSINIDLNYDSANFK